MQQALVSVQNVRLIYPIYSIRAQSLRNSVVNLAVGGRLFKTASDIITVQALTNVSMTVHEGDRVGVIGHNGSGKTSLLKVIAGIYQPTDGVVQVRGQISSMIDIGLGIDGDQTGIENLMAMGHMRGLSSKQIRARIPEILDFSELGAFIHLPLKTFSAGMQARLVFSMATAFDPDILLLDEWLGAGDANFINKAAERMNSLVGRSRAMVFATHDTSMVERVCNKVLILDAGQVEYFGDCAAYFDAKRAEAAKAR